MALHTELPIYKKGCELVSLAFEVQTNMRRDFKRSLGEKITGHCTEMVNLMALANATRGAQRAVHIRDLLARQHATTAIAEVMGETLLLAWAGETFQLSMKPIWVQPLAIAISVRQGCAL